MSEQDQGNKTTEIMYKMATEPVFATDNLKPHENVSWEVTSLSDEETPEPQIEPQEPDVSNLETPEKEEQFETEEVAESSQEEDHDEEKEKIKKKNRISEKKRIADLTRQLKEAQSVAHNVLSRNQYLEGKLTEKQKESLAQEENLLTSQKERVKKYLTDALEEGDNQKIAEAHDLLSQYNADLRLINSRKNAPIENQQQLQPQPTPSYQEPLPQEYRDNGIEWLERNPWANPSSEDYDQELYEEADNYSIKLMKKYKISGRSDEIGTPEFYDDISSFMQGQYEIENVQSVSKSPQPKGRIQMKSDPVNKVAPVSRNEMPGQPTRKGNEIVLTPEQKEFALSLKGIIRDPKTGQKIMDNRVLEEIYKRNLMRG